MYVRNRMTCNPYCVTINSTINEAIALMTEKNLKRLPVVENEKVVGVLTKGDIQKVSPTKATSLSIFEINYLLNKVTVKDAMTSNVHVVSPDNLLEEAAVIMRENKIGTLPVVENNKIVGIITESDIFDSFIDILGFKDEGSRITIETIDSPGILADIAQIFKVFNVNITHVVAYRMENGTTDLMIRVDTTETNEIEKKLNQEGYKIKHILKNK